MTKNSLTIFIVALISVSPAVALSVGAPAPSVIEDHAGLFQWLIGLALIGQGFWISRFINQNDESHSELKAENDKQWTAAAEQSRALAEVLRHLAELKAEHNLLSQKPHRLICDDREADRG